MLENEFSVESLVASESFQAYCLGKESDGYWTEWVKEHPARQSDIQEAYAIVLALYSHLSSDEITAQQERLRSLSGSSGFSENSQKNRTRKVAWPIPAVISVAAAILILAAVWLGGAFNAEAPMLSLTTEYGQTKELVLPDGSQLTLNANSHVRYASTWEGDQTRQIWLEGEAFLDVTHLPDQPFVVHAGKADVNVLGTTFNVRTREKDFSVLLVEGKVEITQGAEISAVLSPGHRATLQGEELSVDSVDVTQFIAWKDNRMVIHGQPIQYIVDRLSWENNIDITVADSAILNKRVSAVLQTSDPEVLLSALAEIYELTITQTGQLVYQIE